MDHYFVTALGKAIRLPLDKSVFLGRGEGNLLRIADDRVSRQHAELCWNGDAFQLTDLNSTNGTRVNGSFEEQIELTDGDVVQVGEDVYVYRAVHAVEQLRQEPTRARRQFIDLETKVVPELQLEGTDGVLSGKLSSLPVGELLQMLSAAARTGLLILQARRCKVFLYFYKGEVTQADLFQPDHDVVLGDEAVVQALTIDSGEFTFKPDRQGTSDNVERRLQFLLLEAARLQDEAPA